MPEQQPEGIGGLLTTEVEYAELGRFGDRELRGRCERRSLRLAVGSRRPIRVQLTRLRPVAIEVAEPHRRYEVPVDAPPDPWLQAARRLLMVWVAAKLTTLIVSGLRGRPQRATVQQREPLKDERA